jgi:nucleotide-binding universal stress UspA family protein
MNEKLKILIPTDFSVQADYAYIMVNKLAQKLDMEITFLHVLSVPDTVTMDAQGNIQTCGEIDVNYVVTQKDIALKKLMALKMTHGSQIHTDLVLGKITTAILDYAERNAFDLIVMGTKGKTGWSERLIGSETQLVSRKSKVPVLSLMCDRSDLEIQNVVIVHNFEENGNQELSLLDRFIAAFGVQVHLLQICKSTEESEVERIYANMVKFASNNGIANYQKHVLKDTDVENGVIHFNQMNNMDIVCIGTHGKGGLFHHSATEALINHMFKPIISFQLKTN